MTADELKAYQKTQPFKPFRIVLNDGKSYDVPHPNFVWVRTWTVCVATHGDVESGLWDRFDQVALNRIKDVEVVASATRADGTSGK